MDHHGGGLRCDHGIDRIALVLDPEALRLQTHTADHRTAETMIETIIEVHRPLPTNVSQKTIIGAFRNRLVKIGDHHKERDVSKTLRRSFRPRTDPIAIPTQRLIVGGNRDLLNDKPSSSARD
jgi:hypothetical protein